MMIIRPKKQESGVEDAGQLADCVAHTELWVPSKLGVGAQTWLRQWIPVSATEEFDAALLFIDLETIQDDTARSCFKNPRDSRHAV